MLSKKELKQQEENRKLAAFCRYLRKNPDLFNEHNLHQLMLEDQNKKCPLGPQPAIPEPVHEEPVEIIIDKPPEKIDEPCEVVIDKLPEILAEPELKEKKKRAKKEPKEKKPRKSKKKEPIEDKSEELKLSDLPEGPYPLERQCADPCLDPEPKPLEPGPVDEIKESDNLPISN